MNRYFSSTSVSGEYIDDLWKCSRGCDALPMWVNFIVGSLLIVLIVLAVRL
jgi:hypothetical protein